MAIKELSQRQLRVGEEIKRIIASEIIQGKVRNLQDFEALITIMEAQVSPDLKYAYVYFVSSKPELDSKIEEALQLAAGHFRKTVAAKTSLRCVPEMRFVVDKTLEEVDKIERLLRDPKVAKDLAE